MHFTLTACIIFLRLFLERQEFNMKKRLLLIVAFVCALFVLPNAASADSSTWEENYDTTYEFRISSVDDLYQLATLVNEGYDFNSRSVYLDLDINLSGREWIPIGISHKAPFKGTFYGQGHVIRGLSYSDSVKDYSARYWSFGLFGYLQGQAVIDNLTLDNVSIDIYYDNYSEDKYLEGVGGIAGSIDTTNPSCIAIRNSSVNGRISVDGASYPSVGGLVGNVSGDGTSSVIEFCTNMAMIEASNLNGVGGILGNADIAFSLRDCINRGNVTGDSNVGGIIGNAHFITYNRIGANFMQCQNFGDISGQSGCGGLIGTGYNIDVYNSSNSGYVQGNDNTGGIAGSMNAALNTDDVDFNKFMNCTNDGLINAIGEGYGEYAGGICGYACGIDFSECTNNGDVHGNESVGGIAGLIRSCDNPIVGWIFRIFNCENNGTIYGTSNVAGIVGESAGVNEQYADKASISSNTNRGQVNGSVYVGGIIGSLNARLYSGYTANIWPLVTNNENLGSGNTGCAIIGRLDADSFYGEDSYNNQRIYRNFWTDTIQLEGIEGNGLYQQYSIHRGERWEKRIWGNSGYNVSTGMLTDPYTDPDGNLIISISGQVAPPDYVNPNNPSIVVSFDAAGVTANPENIEVKAGSSIQLPTLADTEDYRFLGWTANGTNYDPGATVKVNDNTTFVARWESTNNESGNWQEVMMYIGDTYYSVNGGARYLDVAPYIKNNRTYVPIRALTEAFGAQVEWYQQEGRVNVSLNDLSVDMYIGDTSYYINGKRQIMDVVPELVNNRTFLPVRFVTEALGVNVEAIYYPDGTTKAVCFRYIK